MSLEHYSTPITLTDTDIQIGISYFLSIYPNKFRMAKFLASHKAIYKAVLFPFIQAQKKKNGLRFQYPFLNSEDCPPEFKIMVADRISAYHRACDAHSQLLNCTSLIELQNKANEVVSNMIINHKITKELDYFKEHKKPLGKLPYFKDKNSYNTLNMIELYKKNQAVKKRIRDIKNELTKNILADKKTRLQILLTKKLAEQKDIQNILSLNE